MDVKTYLLARAKEPSTWRGIVVLLTAFGIALSPEQTNAIVAVGLAIAGVIGAFTSDQKQPDAQDKPVDVVAHDPAWAHVDNGNADSDMRSSDSSFTGSAEDVDKRFRHADGSGSD